MENIKLSYEDLLKVTGRSIQQLRRYALAFHGVSPDAPRQSGKAREFSLTDGFAVYLMGVLVNEGGLTLAEAENHVWQILWNAGRKGPQADLNDLGFLRPSIGWENGFPVADVLLRIYPGPRPAYEFRVFKEKPAVVEDEEKYTQAKVESYTSYWLPNEAMYVNGTDVNIGKVYELPLLVHLEHYFKSLRALGF